MHGPLGLSANWTNQFKQQFSDTDEVLTKATGVIRGLPIDRDR